MVLPVSADILVIGHPDISATSIDSAELADIFLKRQSRYADGKVVPVNRLAKSTIRTQFESAILQLSEREIKKYWLKLRFKGVRPPVIQNSDNAAILFVKRVPGAISYINSDTVPEGTILLFRIP